MTDTDDHACDRRSQLVRVLRCIGLCSSVTVNIICFCLPAESRAFLPAVELNLQIFCDAKVATDAQVAMYMRLPVVHTLYRGIH